jgi:hypothetical protein
VVQRLVVDLAEALRHRLDRLAAAVQHQPAQVALTTSTLISARQGREDVVGEGFQTSTDRSQLGCCEATQQPSPRCWDRGNKSLTPYPSAANLTESY